ncbi:kinase-like protein [Exidia glandulosa HHB12029]|uniref:non-specific serine/threonine protein kinase n=1 Tax=Exidia glandulosa HHB12029 TaxID=1314781 RepID=A0A166ACH2_EXIGL|nr:kinase-like protein [Exidia glandulosa HHB12029]
MTTHVIASSSNAVSSGAPTFVGNHQFKVGRRVGEGSFGVVFEGVSVANGTPVAIKFEPRKSEAPQLRDEYRSYRTLAGTSGIPQTYYFGQEGLHNVLVMDLFGPNLEDLFDICGRKYSLKTVCMLAKQMLTRVQSIHEKFLIYRDIKPDNFLIGPPGSKTANVVHIVDFGMAKHYRDPKTKVHIPYRERKSLSGTARYMSINTHLGREQSRRDDLESLGHVFLYFLRGSLPWQGLKAATNRQKYERIGEKKQTTPISELCESFPEEFAIYMNYVRKLGFEETPDYEFLRELFSKVLKAAGEEDDGMFDWVLLNGGKGWEASVKKQSSSNHQRRDRDRDRERHRERASHQALAPTTPNITARTSTAGAATGGDANPSPLVLTPAPAHVSSRRDRERERDRERRRLDTQGSAAAAAAGVGGSPMATRRSSAQHVANAHPYASTTGAVHSQAPSAFRPGAPGEAYAYGNGSVNQAPGRQRAMTPNTGNGMDMNRAQMSQSRVDRRLEDGRQEDEQHKGGFMSLICCR